MKNLILENDRATSMLGQKISEIILNSDKQDIEIHLQGDLGAGKTHFTKGIAKGLGIDDEITSPTFSIVHEFEGETPLLHIDFYRSNLRLH